MYQKIMQYKTIIWQYFILFE